MKQNHFRRFFDRYWGVVTSLIVINLFFALTSEYYWSRYNVLNIIDHSAIALLLSTGMVFVLATGGIDLSVGSILALSGIIAALAMKSGVPVVMAVIIGVGCGAAVGLVNGFIISFFRLQPFIVTLAMLSIVRGLSLILTGGNPIIGMPDGFLTAFSGSKLVGNGVYLAAGFAIVSALMMSQTRFGQYAQAIGGSEEAAYLCGINPKHIRIIVYAISGALAAMASMIFMADMDAAEPIAGLTTEWMEAIAAPIIGGNSLDGGRGFVFGAVIGVLILSSIKSGLNMMGVGQHFQQIAIGTVIIAAVIIDSLRHRKTGV